MRVIPVETKHSMPRKSLFLTFEPVTVVPIQQKMIVADMLSKKELDWLNDYHQTCRDKVEPLFLNCSIRLSTSLPFVALH